MELQDKCAQLVERLKLASADDIVSIAPLSGGVSCDIAAVDLGTRRICVKFALPKLRVAEDWHAPLGRNSAEYKWLEFAQRVVPGSTPTLLGRDDALCGFAMEFIAPRSAYLWKTALLASAPIQDEAHQVGDTLGRIHAASSQPDFDTGRFQNHADFRELRLAPYLEFTASKHGDVKGRLLKLVAMLEMSQAKTSVLIHGDVSPKNIFFRRGNCMILDAECATMGDAAFDLAFCVNHLALKAFHMPQRARALLAELLALWQAYRAHVAWESPDDLERRIAELLPALMLARIDGKSPVEYLTETTRAQVRTVAIELLKQSPTTLDELAARLAHACATMARTPFRKQQPT